MIPNKLKLEYYFHNNSCFLVLSCKIENCHLKMHDKLKLRYSLRSKYWQRNLRPREIDIHQCEFQYTRWRGSRSQLIHALLEIELWEEVEGHVSPLFNTYILSTWKISKQIIFTGKIIYKLYDCWCNNKSSNFVTIPTLLFLFAKHIWVFISRYKFFCLHSHKPKYDHLVLSLLRSDLLA